MVYHLIYKYYLIIIFIILSIIITSERWVDTLSIINKGKFLFSLMVRPLTPPPLQGGESLWIRAGHFPHLGCGKWAPENFLALVRGIIKERFFSNIPWRKLGKNVNLFSPKHELFLKSNRKSITLLNSRDVEIEPGCGKWAWMWKMSPPLKLSRLLKMSLF